MDNIEWHRTYSLLKQMVGYKVIIDGTYNGVVSAILGGPIEIFFLVDVGDNVMFIDTSDTNRIDFLE